MAEDVWTVKRILEWIEGYLAQHGDDNPRLSAQWLVAEALGATRMQLFLELDRPLNAEERAIIRDYTRRRGAGEPLQYITGTVGFRHIAVRLRPGVLIPRPETELLVSEALALLPVAPKPQDEYEAELLRQWSADAAAAVGGGDDGREGGRTGVAPSGAAEAVSAGAQRKEARGSDDAASSDAQKGRLLVADICTGSGCIACSIAHEHPATQVIATDISPEAVALARENADALGYITIPDTNISYPIMYDFNWYYNDHDIDRNEIVRGSIYFYWSGPSGNTVITGHNSRTSGTMFHQLHKVQDNRNGLKTYRNRVWPINTYGVTGYWEVWALYEEPSFSDPSKSSQYYNTCFPGKYDSMSDAEKQAWIDYQLERSELSFTPNVTIKDRFMTLLTCGDSHADSAGGARLYVFLRWVGED